ncbi:GntR family transcriptional regulator [Streptomyces sp. BH105]|uniref:GntR family transcriptional regulator n=1 Tax=Streptomyces sp. BH105 TaxID=3410408 RepID=UPI003CF8AD34
MARLHPSTFESPLSGTAYWLLRDQIRTCELLPGQVLTIRQAAVRLGTGVAPARTALAGLAASGLVRRVSGSEYQVPPLTTKAVDDLFLVWRLIGPEIARLGVVGASGPQLEGMRQLMAHGDTIALMGSPPRRAARFIDVADAVFSLLCVATTNDRLLETYRYFGREMARVWAVLLADAVGPRLVQAAHAAWLPALERRDGVQADAIARGFIDSSHQRARRLARGGAALT